MKAFTTAAKAHHDGEEKVGEKVSITLDDRKLTFIEPSSKTLLLLMSIYAERDSGDQLLALGNSINLMFNLLETPEDRNYLKRRLFDPKDDLGEEEISEIFRYLIEEWSGRPIEEPSASE